MNKVGVFQEVMDVIRELKRLIAENNQEIENIEKQLADLRAKLSEEQDAK